MRWNIFYSMGCLFRLGWATLVFIALLALVKHFIFDVMPVSGESMFPYFHNRDVIVLNKISYVTGTPKRGDNVVLRFPGDPNHTRYIKRLIGLPGDHVHIADGTVTVNDTELFEPYLGQDVTTYPATDITLDKNQYYLLGDNRPVSNDSRIWGSAGREDFIGKAFFIIWPLNRMHAVAQPVY